MGNRLGHSSSVPAVLETPLEMLTLSDRAKGCLYGQVIGDALGMRYEFEDHKSANWQINKDIRGHSILPMLGGGPFRLAPGQVTDDTEMAVALGRSLVRMATFDPTDVAVSYATWYFSPAFAIGGATRMALTIDKEKFYNRDTQEGKMAIFNQFCQNARQYNTSSLSNGPLMRISPLAIAAVNWSEESLLKAAEIETKLTHTNEVVIDAVKVYTVALRTAILTGDRLAAYNKAASVAQTEVIKDHLETAKTTMKPVKLSTGAFTDGDQVCIGYLGVALQFAFYQLLKAKSFTEGLEEVIRAGGDTDTNGCISGSLLGAIFGAPNIPNEWKRTVVQLKCDRQRRYSWIQLADLEEFALNLTAVKEPNL